MYISISFYYVHRKFLTNTFLRQMLKMILVKRSEEFLQIFVSSNLKLKKILNLRNLVNGAQNCKLGYCPVFVCMFLYFKAISYLAKTLIFIDTRQMASLYFSKA